MHRAAKTHKQISEKASRFSESVIREMTRQAMLHGAVNLAQGFPDFSAPDAIKRAAQEAIAADVNQYAITWGAKKLRDGIARGELRRAEVLFQERRHIARQGRFHQIVRRAEPQGVQGEPRSRGRRC